MCTTVTPIAVANHLILHKGKDDGDLSPLKLIKLVYLSHGWHWAVRDEPLLSEQVQAWRYGPVLPSLYFALRHYGRKPVGAPITEGLEEGKVESAKLTKEQQEVVDTVYDSYKEFSAAALSALTHQKGTPWHKAWHSGDGRNVTIPEDEIKKHFVSLLP